MKTDTHPDNYRQVIFEDTNNGERFLVYSAVATTETAKWEDGKEYDLYKTEISSSSHPFYTGADTAMDRTGRADKFRKRAEKAAKKKAVAKAPAQPKADEATEPEAPAESAPQEAVEAEA